MQYLLIPMASIKSLDIEGMHRADALVDVYAYLRDVKTIDLIDADAKPYIPYAIEGGM